MSKNLKDSDCLISRVFARLLVTDDSVIDPVLENYEKLLEYDKKLCKLRSDHPDLDVQYWCARFTLLEDKYQKAKDTDKVTAKQVKSLIKAEEEILKTQGVKGLKNLCVKVSFYTQSLKESCRALALHCKKHDLLVLDVLPLIERYIDDFN